ncbi:hypothetical protein V5O48_015432 [Marasmius crinis-equi]|uniref:DUF6697 domain-containing protein n=1 Tax=Marasmius crinis-equi TaxID=585013 RepID=A0ABR3EUW5_9AGAR
MDPHKHSMPLSKLEEIIDDFLIPTVEPEDREDRFTSSDSEDTQVESSSATRANSLETSPQPLYIDETPSIKKERRFDEAKIFHTQTRSKKSTSRAADALPKSLAISRDPLLPGTPSVVQDEADDFQTVGSHVRSDSTPHANSDVESQHVIEPLNEDVPIPTEVSDTAMDDLDDDEIQIMEWDPQKEAQAFSNFKESVNPKLAKKSAKKYKQEDMPLQTIDRYTSSITNLYVEEDEDLDINFTSTRAFISDTFGGSPQGTFPSVRGDKLTKMIKDGFGEGDLTFLNLNYNPYMPQMSGRSGIFFSNGYAESERQEWADEFDAELVKRENSDKKKSGKKKSGNKKKDEAKAIKEDDGLHRVFVCLDTKVWLYIGQYQMTFKNSLSKQEWHVELTERVKSTWVDGAMTKGWGLGTRIRVFLRNRHGSGRKFTPAEYLDLMEELGGDKEARKKFGSKVTKEQIRNSFDRGEELIGVNVMECVRYDYEFQRKLQTAWPSWEVEQKQKAEEEEQRKKEKGEEQKTEGKAEKTSNKRSRKQTDSGKKGPSPKKRKTNKGSKAPLDSDESSESESENSHTDSDFEEDDHARYISRGTRSRPRAVRYTR